MKSSEALVVSNLNDAFMKFERRAEGVDPNKLVETFVDVGPLFTLLGIKDHQILHGRRGTGKTHALTYLAETQKKNNNIPIYCDLRTAGSNTSIYGDPTRELPERATRLLIDVVSELHSFLHDFCVNNSVLHDLSITGPLLDLLSDSIGDVRVQGTIEIETKDGQKRQSGTESGLNLSLSTTPSVSVSGKSSSSAELTGEKRVKESGSKIFYVHFGSLMASLRNLLAAMPDVRVWLLLDEWSTLPIELQPYLADLLRRCVFPVRGITVKIAAIEQRSNFKIELEKGNYIGLEIGADIPSDLNLDDFMVFENQPEKARNFYKQLFFKHFLALENASSSDSPKTADQLVSFGFTQANVFDEFVQAAEGVPRDAMNIISLAATRALDDKISMKHIRDAARDWFQRGKERDLIANDKCMNLLYFIVDEVIGKKSARAFLLKSNSRNPLIEELFDARVLHVLKRNISGKDQPGERFDVYKIDYGCFVELLNTAKSPKTLLGSLGEEQIVTEESTIPQDDYRSIRRAILQIENFEAADAAANIQS